MLQKVFERTLKKFPHRRCDLFEVCFEREMPGFQELHCRVGVVSPESLSTGRNEIGIEFAPHGQ